MCTVFTELFVPNYYYFCLFLLFCHWAKVGSVLFSILCDYIVKRKEKTAMNETYTKIQNSTAL